MVPQGFVHGRPLPYGRGSTGFAEIYCTAIVTGWLARGGDVCTVTTTGAEPGGTPAGNIVWTTYTPTATGDSPANWTGAVALPTVTVTGLAVDEAGVPYDPAASGEASSPRPVQSIVSGSPALAGLPGAIEFPF